MSGEFGHVPDRSEFAEEVEELFGRDVVAVRLLSVVFSRSGVCSWKRYRAGLSREGWGRQFGLYLRFLTYSALSAYASILAVCPK